MAKKQSAPDIRSRSLSTWDKIRENQWVNIVVYIVVFILGFWLWSEWKSRSAEAERQHRASDPTYQQLDKLIDNLNRKWQLEGWYLYKQEERFVELPSGEQGYCEVFEYRNKYGESNVGIGKCK